LRKAIELSPKNLLTLPNDSYSAILGEEKGKMQKNLSLNIVSTLFISLLLIGPMALSLTNTTSALPSNMTFTTGDTIHFGSTTQMSFWSNVTMKFGTGIIVNFVEVSNGNNMLEPCDIVMVIFPHGYQLVSCEWLEVLDPAGKPTGIEFHIDGQMGPDEWHIDQIYPPMPIPLPYPPGTPFPAEKKVDIIEPCNYYVVHEPAGWYPPECSWWEIMDPETGHPTGFEFHVDWTNESCEFHVDQVTPGPYRLLFPWYEIEARQKITEIKPCDWFAIIDPIGFSPTPCSWWEIVYNGQPTGLEFHVDQAPGDGRFHVDQVMPDPLNVPPTYPTTVRMKVNRIQACDSFIVDDPATTPKPCTWWKVVWPQIGDVEFHVDSADPVTGIFHVDTVLPGPVSIDLPTHEVIAEKKFTGLGPCDWFNVINPPSWVPQPCTWWKITWPVEWAGVTFHVDSNDGISKFHIDAADPLPLGPTPPPWSVTAEPVQPPTGPWYVKPAYPDYAPSGMPDFDQKQDMWGPGPGTYTWCGPVSVANSLWWLDSKFESIYNTNPVPPPTISDHFNLVTAYSQWDDHDVRNVDPLVHNLAFWMDTDGVRTQDGHTGTRWQDMESGIKQYIMQQGVGGMFEVHNSTYPQFAWIESEIEKCQDVVLFLEFYRWTGSSWLKLYDNPSLEAGHFVTCAGVNSTTSELLISDPYQDAFEAGTDLKGRSPVPHPYPHPFEFHNDTQYVSHDAYQAQPWMLPPPPPPPMSPTTLELIGYLQTMGYDPSWRTFITAAVVTSPLLVVHDVATTNLTSAKTVIGQGYGGNVTVTAQNHGDFAENFNVTTYANTTKTTDQNFVLTNGTTQAKTFVWNTTGFAYGNYTLVGAADIVPGETDIADNNYTCGVPVHVGVPGDVSGPTVGVYDKIVNMRDISYLIQFFNTNPGSPNWKPNADINNDGTVNMRDIQIAILNFNKHE
jgi:hypothetical protein